MKKSVSEPTLYWIGKVPTNVQGNYEAWAICVRDSIEGKENAQDIAAEMLGEDWEGVPDGFSLGYDYMVFPHRSK